MKMMDTTKTGIHAWFAGIEKWSGTNWDVDAWVENLRFIIKSNLTGSDEPTRNALEHARLVMKALTEEKKTHKMKAICKKLARKENNIALNIAKVSEQLGLADTLERFQTRKVTAAQALGLRKPEKISEWRTKLLGDNAKDGYLSSDSSMNSSITLESLSDIEPGSDSSTSTRGRRNKYAKEKKKLRKTFKYLWTIGNGTKQKNMYHFSEKKWKRIFHEKDFAGQIEEWLKNNPVPDQFIADGQMNPNSQYSEKRRYEMALGEAMRDYCRDNHITTDIDNDTIMFNETSKRPDYAKYQKKPESDDPFNGVERERRILIRSRF